MPSIAIEKLALDSAHLQPDISRFISFKTQFLPKVMMEEISESLARNAEGMFLWVKLVLEGLATSSTAPRIIREKLKNLPAGLSGIYERVLDKISYCMWITLRLP